MGLLTLQNGEIIEAGPGADWEESLDNTSTTPLGIGATFTGVMNESKYTDVRVIVEADQPGTLFFDFTVDGVNFYSEPVLGFAHVANKPTFHVAVMAGAEFRARFVNTSGIAQTFFRLYTYFGQFKNPTTPVGENILNSTDATVVKAVLTGDTDGGVYRRVGVTPFGSLKATLFDNQTGSRQIVDLNGAAKVGEAIILAGDVLYGQNLSPFLWSTLAINGGLLIAGAGEHILQTGTTANGQFILQSKKRARFMLSQFNIVHFGVQLLPTVLLDPNTIMEWGFANFINDTIPVPVLNTTANGAFIRVQGGVTPIWNIVSIKNGVETATPLASWNGTNAALFNPTPDLSVYEMQYNAGTAFFFQGPNFIHRIAGLTATYTATYHHPVFLRIRNINGNTTNRQLATRAAGTYRLGEERGETISRAFTANTLIKTGSGYVAAVSLSRAGSAGGNGTLKIYDGIDATGILMCTIDVGGDDIKGHVLNSTFSFGLFIAITGSGTNTANIGFE